MIRDPRIGFLPMVTEGTDERKRQMAGQSDRNNVEKYRSSIESLRDRVTILSSRLERVKADLEGIKDHLDGFPEGLADVREDLLEVKEDMVRIKDDTAALSRKIGPLDSRLDYNMGLNYKALAKVIDQLDENIRKLTNIIMN